jgi:hypothetical protein
MAGEAWDGAEYEVTGTVETAKGEGVDKTTGQQHKHIDLIHTEGRVPAMVPAPSLRGFPIESA